MNQTSKRELNIDHRLQRRQAFTLLEVLLVLGILALIMGLLVPRLTNRQRDAKIEATKISMEGIRQAIQLYALDHDGETPTMTEGLKVLIEPRPRDRKWKGPYLEQELVDTWGQPIAYRMPSQNPRRTFDLISAGPDQITGTEDDITN